MDGKKAHIIVTAPAELKKRLKVKVAREGVTMKDKINELIRAYLNENGKPL